MMAQQEAVGWDHPAVTITRPGWDDYFLHIAKAVARRGDCTRAQHGAVIVRDHRIVGTGYNGTAPGATVSCLNGDCPRATSGKHHPDADYSDCIASHAEQNAVAFARYEDMRGSTMYVTGKPCDMCAKLISAAGIVRVVYAA